MKAFVTGGSGFVGGRLIERLLADGHEVRALARSDRSADRIRERGGTPVPGSLEDTRAMQAGAEGCDVAFHAAAELGDGGRREDFVRGNVTGTENVLQAARDAGVSRFVHVSTEAVLLNGHPLVQVDETAPTQPRSPVHYTATKALAEQLVRAANGAHLETVIVRPRWVWGQGDTTLLPILAAMVRSGRFAWFGDGRHLTSTTHVTNVAHGLVLAAERGRPSEVYFVTDGEPVVFREFITSLLASCGVEPPAREIPTSLAGILAHGGELAWKVLPLPGQPPLTRLAYWLSSQECTIRIDKAREELAYTPVITIAEGLAELEAGPGPVGTQMPGSAARAAR